MQLRNKYYPYPVIVEGGEYYSGSVFSSSVKQSMEGYNVKLLLSAELNDEVLLDMIEKGQLSYAHHIECPQTCFRKLVKTKETDTEIIIRDSEVNGTVQICSFVIANEEIEKYTNTSFSQDYLGWKFNLEKGCIMAIGNKYNLQINKQRDDLANTSSIFSIVKDLDPTANTVSVDIHQQKIIITLPEITYNQYSNVQTFVDVQPVMHSMLILPALTYAFTELRSAGDQLYIYEGNRWFRGLRKACEKINIALDEESLKAMDVIKVPQLLMDSPILKAIDFCANGGGSYED